MRLCYAAKYCFLECFGRISGGHFWPISQTCPLFVNILRWPASSQSRCTPRCFQKLGNYWNCINCRQSTQAFWLRADKRQRCVHLLRNQPVLCIDFRSRMPLKCSRLRPLETLSFLWFVGHYFLTVSTITETEN